VRCRFAYCRVATITRSRASAKPKRARQVGAPHVIPVDCQAGASAARRGEPAHLVEPPGREHRVDACGDAVGERRPGSTTR
jgi:hypothetical protein